MARHKGTTVTYEVKVQLPKGSNAHEMQLYIRDAIKSHLDPADPHFSIPEETYTVRLVKKETTYG